MMENKKVTYKHLKIGQEIKGYEEGNLHSGFTGYVKAVNPAYVTVEMWRKGGNEERINTSAMFLVEMTEEEFRTKYREKAKAVLEEIQKKLLVEEIGYHEMWNAWLMGNPYEIAQCCVKEKMHIVGYCTDIVPKRAMFGGEVLDVGVCAEYEDGERFWCHYSQNWMKDMLEMHKELLN